MCGSGSLSASPFSSHFFKEKPGDEKEKELLKMLLFLSLFFFLFIFSVLNKIGTHSVVGSHGRGNHKEQPEEGNFS